VTLGDLDNAINKINERDENYKQIGGDNPIYG
jgi:hypothetical protein